MVRLLQVNEKNSFAGALPPAAPASLVTPGSKGAPFWATAAGLSRWKIWLFVHLAPRGRRRNWPQRPPPRPPDIAGLRLIQRPHGGKDPQGLRVEGVAGPLG